MLPESLETAGNPIFQNFAQAIQEELAVAEAQKKKEAQAVANVRQRHHEARLSDSTGAPISPFWGALIFPFLGPLFSYFGVILQKKIKIEAPSRFKRFWQQIRAPRIEISRN